MMIKAHPGMPGYIALPDQALPLVHETWGWIMDPRFLKEMKVSDRFERPCSTH